MWSRGVIGVVLFLVGLVWIGQGTDAISNSKLMSGHGQYTLLGIVVLVAGLALVAWAVQIHRRPDSERPER
jgi:formate hydrogenlyase subunit 3/multisubunit Na+/H+ antiporter MnhD subunit